MSDNNNKDKNNPLALPALTAQMRETVYTFTRSDFYQDSRAKCELTTQMIGEFTLCDMFVSTDADERAKADAKRVQFICYPVAVFYNPETRLQRVFVYTLNNRTNTFNANAMELDMSRVKSFFARHTREVKQQTKQEVQEIDFSAFAL